MWAILWPKQQKKQRMNHFMTVSQHAGNLYHPRDHDPGIIFFYLNQLPITLSISKATLITSTALPWIYAVTGQVRIWW